MRRPVLWLPLGLFLVFVGHGIIRHQHFGAITDADLPESMAAYQEAGR